MKVQYPLHKFLYLNVHWRLFTVVSRVCAAPVGQDRICQMRSAVASLFPKSVHKIFTENPAQVPILTCSLEAIYRRLQSLRGGCRSGPSLRHPHVYSYLPTTYIESNPSNTTVTCRRLMRPHSRGRISLALLRPAWQGLTVEFFWS